MISEAIKYMLERVSVQWVEFCFTQGERNAPAKTWLSEFTKQAIMENNTKTILRIKWSDLQLSQDVLPIIMEWK